MAHCLSTIRNNGPAGKWSSMVKQWIWAGHTSAPIQIPFLGWADKERKHTRQRSSIFRLSAWRPTVCIAEIRRIIICMHIHIWYTVQTLNRSYSYLCIIENCVSRAPETMMKLWTIMGDNGRTTTVTAFIFTASSSFFISIAALAGMLYDYYHRGDGQRERELEEILWPTVDEKGVKDAGGYRSPVSGVSGFCACACVRG